MIIEFEKLAESFEHDVCIVGAGPIGLAMALASEKRGQKVLLLESGIRIPDDFYIDLGRAAHCPDTHAALSEANCRAYGGTSLWWGGRCLPFDPIDFEDRAAVPASRWPISYADISVWYPDAADFFQCGSSNFSGYSPGSDLKDIRLDQIERWCPVPAMSAVHNKAIESSSLITVVLGATVTDLNFSSDGSRVTGLAVAGRGRTLTVSTQRVALAAGCVQTTRLLLSVQSKHPDLFGGKDGPLGRYYMGHIFGKIADVVFDDPKDALALDFFLDHGCYARRRFTFPAETQIREKLNNISFAAGNPQICDPSHRNGVLSLIWLVLASPLGKRLLPKALLSIYVGERRSYGAHLSNIVGNFFPAIMSALGIFRDKYMRKPGKPAIFLWNEVGRYSLHYHAEQTPSADNRLTLSQEKDAFGLERLDIAFRYDRKDAENVVRSHRVLDQALRDNKIGRLEFSGEQEALVKSVLDQARDGMHQIGATRMSNNPQEGVVDANCKVHGVDNLYIASTSVLPSSGNANPTFVGAALAIRLAHHLADGNGG